MRLMSITRTLDEDRIGMYYGRVVNSDSYEASLPAIITRYGKLVRLYIVSPEERHLRASRLLTRAITVLLTIPHKVSGFGRVSVVCKRNQTLFKEASALLVVRDRPHAFVRKCRQVDSAEAP